MSAFLQFMTAQGDLKLKAALELSDDEIEDAILSSDEIRNLFMTGQSANNFWLELIKKRYSDDVFQIIDVSTSNNWRNVYYLIKNSNINDKFLLLDQPNKNFHDLTEQFNGYKCVKVVMNTMYLLKYDGELLIVSSDRYGHSIPGINFSKYENTRFKIGYLAYDEIPVTFLDVYDNTIRPMFPERDLPEMVPLGITIKHIKAEDQIIDVSIMSHRDLTYLNPLDNFYARTLNGSVLLFDPMISVLKEYQTNGKIGLKIIIDNPNFLYFTFKDPIFKIQLIPVSYKHTFQTDEIPLQMIFTTRQVGSDAFIPHGTGEIYKIPTDSQNKQLIRVCGIPDPKKVMLVENSSVLFYQSNILYTILNDKDIGYHDIGFKIKYAEISHNDVHFIDENGTHNMYSITDDFKWTDFNPKNIKFNVSSAIIDNVHDYSINTYVHHGILNEIFGYDNNEVKNLNINNIIRVDYNNFNIYDYENLYSFIVRRWT